MKLWTEHIAEAIAEKYAEELTVHLSEDKCVLTIKIRDDLPEELARMYGVKRSH